MPVHELTNPATPSTGIIAHATGVTIGNLADGIQYYKEITATGAQTALDFDQKPRLRIFVTGNLSGAYANPPTDVPTLPANLTSWTFVIEYIQDATGNRAIPLATLFANYAQEGVAVANTASEKPTVVFLIGNKASNGTVTYSVSFPQEIAGEQVTFGTIPTARLPDASASVKGLVQLGTSSTAAAAGNHTHGIPDTKRFVVDKSDGSALTAGDYPVLEDLNFAGVVTLWTKVTLQGGPGAMTATVKLKINSSDIIGTSLAASGTASGDGTATSGNRFSLRQGLYLNIASPTGSFTRATGLIHIVKDGLTI
jgi:hypothetical protein